MMEQRDRPKILLCAVHEALQNNGFAVICSGALVFLLPWWLRWLFFYLGGIIFIASIIVPFLDDWRPRIRVHTRTRAVVITGCDSGFGHGLAQRLDSIGLQVFAGCLLPEGKGAETLKKLCSERLHILPLDVTSDDDVQNAAKYVTENLNENKLWAVVNNAGIGDASEIFWASMDNIEKVMEVNTLGVVRVTKAFLPLLCKTKGRVVTVASSAGRFTTAGMVSYCMSKHATVSFCEGLRLELYRFGVKVVLVEPWMHRTPITEEKAIVDSLTKSWERASEEVKLFYSEDYFERYKKALKKFLNYSVSHNPKDVVDCLEEGVLAINPKYTYNPGTLFSRLSFWIFKRCPKPIVDFLLHETFMSSTYS